MLRTGATRTLLRPFTNSTATRARFAHNVAQRAAFGQQNSIAGKKFESLALTAFRGANTAIVRSYASVTPGTTQNVEKEKKLAQEPLASSPQFVSAESSTHPVFSEVGTKEAEDDTDMMAGIRHDMVYTLHRRGRIAHANTTVLRKSSRKPSL